MALVWPLRAASCSGVFLHGSAGALGRFAASGLGNGAPTAVLGGAGCDEQSDDSAIAVERRPVQRGASIAVHGGARVSNGKGTPRLGVLAISLLTRASIKRGKRRKVAETTIAGEGGGEKLCDSAIWQGSVRVTELDVSCAWDVHASLGLCRSLLPLAFDLEKPSDMVGARRMARASLTHPTSSWCCVAYWYELASCALSSRCIWHIADGKTRVWVLAHDSKHRAASAGLLATAGEPASDMFIMPCIRDARVQQAAAGLRLERRLSWHVRALPW
jgi:hypothetical protein